MNVAIYMPLVVDMEKLQSQIEACFTAKRVVSLDVENRLDEIIDLLDDMLEKANEAENMRGGDSEA